MQIKEPAGDITIPSDKDDLDGLNYLAGKSVDYVNKKACEGTVDAHVNTGNVPNILITLDKMDAYGFGYMYISLKCHVLCLYIYLVLIHLINQVLKCTKQICLNYLVNQAINYYDDL